MEFDLAPQNKWLGMPVFFSEDVPENEVWTFNGVGGVPCYLMRQSTFNRAAECPAIEEKIYVGV